jgi:hypothetical protein
MKNYFLNSCQFLGLCTFFCAIHPRIKLRFCEISVDRSVKFVKAVTTVSLSSVM